MYIFAMINYANDFIFESSWQALKENVSPGLMKYSSGFEESTECVGDPA